MWQLLLAGALLSSFTNAHAQEGNMLTFQAGDLRVSFSPEGRIASLYDTVHRREVVAAGDTMPLLTITLDGKTAPLTAVTPDPAKSQLRLAFGDTGVTAVVNVRVKRTHLVLELAEVPGGAPSRIDWGPFAVTIGKTIGATVGVVRDDEFAMGIQALSVQTVGGATPAPQGSRLYAYAIEHDGGVKGSAIALFGCPSGKALETIGEIEVAEGLPHPMLDGEWGKVSPTSRLSYLIVSFGEADLDEVLAFAKKGGFRYVYHPGPFRTWGHFQLNPEQFPEGDESLKRCVERAGREGIRLGLHTLTGFITTNDPYVTPVPDPRLARMGSTTLTGAIDEGTTEIGIADPQPFRNRQTLATAIIGQELVQYGSVPAAEPWKLLGCQRGAFGTKPAVHPAGADIGKLADHEYRTFYPGIDNGMMDEMTNSLVELFNHTGLRQMSFDGLEGLSTYGYGEYARNRFVKQCFDGWKPEVITDASNLLHYLWHVNTRMNWGELTQSAKADVDTYRVNNCQYFEDNLFPTAMGWWRFGGAALDWEATRLADIEYLLAKCAGWNATHGLAAQPGDFQNHGHGEDCLRMVKMWDEARYAGAFSDAQRAKLREKGRDWHLEQTGGKRWSLAEVRYSPFCWTQTAGPRTEDQGPRTNDGRRVLSFTTGSAEHLGNRCPVTNPFEPQPLRFELRALGSFDYESKGSIDLTPAAADDLRREPGLHADAPVLSVADALVNGLKGYEISTRHEGKERPSWVSRVIAPLPQPLNLQQHRGLGCWVRGDGQGELLFVELVARDCKRQYYVPVDFTGERYFEFPLGEMCLGRYYAYDWNHWSGFASWWVTLKGFDYGHVERVTMGFNAVPAGQEVSCAVGGIRALMELGTGPRNPSVSLVGKKVSFGDTLPPGGYLVYDGGPKAEVRDADYRLLRGVTAAGDRVELSTGENPVQVAYEGADGPAPWSRWEFSCIGPEEEVAAR